MATSQITPHAGDRQDSPTPPHAETAPPADQDAPERIWASKFGHWLTEPFTICKSAEYIRADLAAPSAPEGQPITMTYRNWRGEVADRTVTPKRIWWGSTDWHPESGWLMTAYDPDKQADRDFALADADFRRAAPSAPAEVEGLVERLQKLGRDMDRHAQPDWDEHEDMFSAATALTALQARAEKAEAALMQVSGLTSGEVGKVNAIVAKLKGEV